MSSAVQQHRIALYGHRKAEQRCSLAALDGCVSRISCSAPPIEVAHHDSVDLGIESLDPGDCSIDQFARRNSPRYQRVTSIPARQLNQLLSGISERFHQPRRLPLGSKSLLPQSLRNH